MDNLGVKTQQDKVGAPLATQESIAGGNDGLKSNDPGNPNQNANKQQFLGLPKGSNTLSDPPTEMGVTNAFQPKSQIQRTFYGNKQGGSRLFNQQSRAGNRGGGPQTGAISIIERHRPSQVINQQNLHPNFNGNYQGSQSSLPPLSQQQFNNYSQRPPRAQQQIVAQSSANQQQQQQPDFFSKFGQGGGGAPLRDSSGNVITNLKVGTASNNATGAASVQQQAHQQRNFAVNADPKQAKYSAQESYQRELQAQINEKKARENKEKSERMRYDVIQEEKIRRDLDELNRRERGEISKERNKDEFNNNGRQSRNTNPYQNQEQRPANLRDSGVFSSQGSRGLISSIQRRDPNAAYGQGQNNLAQNNHNGLQDQQRLFESAENGQGIQNTTFAANLAQQATAAIGAIGSEPNNQFDSLNNPSANALGGRPPPYFRTNNTLAYSNQGSMLSLMSADGGKQQAERDLKTMQNQLKSKIDEFKLEARQLKHENEIAHNELTKLIGELANKQYVAGPMSGQFAAIKGDQNDYRRQWVRVMTQDIDSKTSQARYDAKPPVIFPSVRRNQRLMSAGREALLPKTDKQLLQAKTQFDPKSSLQTESQSIPIKNVEIREPYAEQVAAKEQKTDVTELDAAYVQDFLKEIGDIEQINHRSDVYIEQRSVETYMKLGNQQNIQEFQMQDPARPPISLQNLPSTQNPPQAQSTNSPKFRAESPLNQGASLQQSQEMGGGFFITESPGVVAERKAPLNENQDRMNMVSPINKGNESQQDISMNEQMNFMLQQDQQNSSNQQQQFIQNKENNLNGIISGANFAQETQKLSPQQDAVYKSQEGLVRESFAPNGIQETAGFAPQQNPMTASYDNNVKSQNPIQGAISQKNAHQRHLSNMNVNANNQIENQRDAGSWAVNSQGIADGEGRGEQSASNDFVNQGQKTDASGFVKVSGLVSQNTQSIIGGGGGGLAGGNQTAGQQSNRQNPQQQQQNMMQSARNNERSSQGEYYDEH